ncbi:unnamed protein product [Sphagnum compactum]
MDRSCLEQLTGVGASTLSTDMLRENLEIMAQSELELMSPGASEPTVSDSSASRTSGQNFGRALFSHLQLAAAAIPPSSSRTLLGPEVELLSASRPKRRNVRISKDPQSVAARHRRERISDRIRMLQRLVPGGTKMDTASMLDEAIHYVKFLKLQLQVLEQLGNSFDSNFTMERMSAAARGLSYSYNCLLQDSGNPNFLKSH